MATPMTAAQVVAQLKKWGIKYVEIPGWTTHNRNQKGAWGPVNGFVWHHTGADVSNASAKSYAGSTLYNGITDLPGPLCHFSIGLDGTVYLVGWGRANHAGGGDPVTLQHVINEDYTGQLHPTKGNTTGVDGNAHFYGVEIQYSGGHEMAAAQYAAALRLSAAVLDFHVERDGWSKDAEAVIAHGEWSSDKWDPGYAPGKIMAMPGVRADVKTALAAGPTQETDMTPDQAAQLQALNDNLLQIGSLTEKDAKGNPVVHGAGYYLAHIHYDALKIVATEAAQTAALTALATAIGKVDAAIDVPALVAEVKAAIDAAVSQVVIHLDIPDAA
jgi:hypothetical protein